MGVWCVFLYVIGGITILTAQNKSKPQRIAHLNVMELLSVMPEVRKADEKLQQYAQQLDQQYQAMLEEYREKLENYQKNQDVLPEAVKEIKIKELADLEMRIQEFQKRAQENLQQKRQELYQPILDRVQNVVEEVAQELGYDYVFDSSTGVLLVYPSGDDILPYVKKRLGL